MWKIMAVVVVLLVVATFVVLSHYAFTDKAERDAKARIKTYRMVAEEQRLIRQILEDKIAVAQIQAKIAPKPAQVPAPVPPVAPPE